MARITLGRCCGQNLDFLTHCWVFDIYNSFWFLVVLGTIQVFVSRCSNSFSSAFIPGILLSFLFDL